MADATGRALEMVKQSPSPVPRSQDTFAQHVQQVVEACDDIASEEAWQAISKLVVAHWQELCRDQAPVQSMTMLSKCTETIIRLRRGQQQSGAQSSADALEEFRALMADVARPDEG
ncbi:MAG TPA: hypothetical protein VI542_37825 [Candidatus Tectomicrobia bacterium]